jgi:lysozyme family protein
MANFNLYLPLLQQVEGGFQALAQDPGNFNSKGELVGTNFGISARFYEHIIKRPPSKFDMQNISKVEAKSIYLQFFWTKNLGNQIYSQSVANTVIDHQVNSGRGIKLAQKVLNDHFGKNLVVDGAMGPNTLNALNSVNAELFVQEYNNAREQYYIAINNPTFINGWLLRLKEFAYSDAFKISTGFIVIAVIASIIIYKNQVV